MPFLIISFFMKMELTIPHIPPSPWAMTIIMKEILSLLLTKLSFHFEKLNSFTRLQETEVGFKIKDVNHT